MRNLIDRDNLLEYIDDNFYPTSVSCYMTVAEARAARERHNMFVDAINNAPVVDAEPVRHGRWIEDDATYLGPGLSKYICSACKEFVGTWCKGLRTKSLFPYCPWCGADMREEENNAPD